MNQKNEINANSDFFKFNNIPYKTYYILMENLNKCLNTKKN